MSTKKKSEIKFSHQDICHNAENTAVGSINKRCGFCEDKGIPILPVRYAVTRTNSNIPIITQPTIYEEIALKDHQFILRLMRSGYIYLYDQSHDRIGAWFVTHDSKFCQFAISKTDNLGRPEFVTNSRDNEPLTFKCHKKEHYLSASFIHWPIAKNQNINLWIMYSELPFPKNALLELAHNEEWRSSNMQLLTLRDKLPATTQQEDIIHSFKIKNLLAEANWVNDGTTYDCYPYIKDFVISNDIGKHLASYIEKVSEQTGQIGCAVALNDDIGIIETLNHDRHLAAKEFQETTGNLGKTRPVTGDDIASQRKVLCYSFLELLKNSQYQQAQHILEEYTRNYNKKSQENHITKMQWLKNGGGRTYVGTQAISNTLITPYDKKLELQEKIKKSTNSIEVNFLEHVDREPFINFSKSYKDKVFKKENDSKILDYDYCRILDRRINKINNSLYWTSSYPETSALFTSILNRILSGNIMTPYSEKLWEDHLLTVDNRNLIIRTIGLNDENIIQNLTTAIKANEDSLIEDILTSKNIVKVIKSFRDYFQKHSEELIEETFWAIIKKQTKDVWNKLNIANNETRLDIVSSWKPFITRVGNIFKKARGLPVEYWINVIVKEGERDSFLALLPEELSSSIQSSSQMEETSSIKTEDGLYSRSSNKPLSQVSSSGEHSVKLSMLVNGNQLNTLKRLHMPQSSEDVTVIIEGTNEELKITSKHSEQIQKDFINILKKESLKNIHRSMTGMLCAYIIFGMALFKKDKASNDWITLTSSFLGVIKGTCEFSDTVKTMATKEIDRESLYLFKSQPWMKNIGKATNYLGIVLAFNQFFNAVQAKSDGESNRVVNAAYQRASLYLISALISFAAIPFGLGLVVAIITILYDSLLTSLGAQELTMQQRLWIRRSIFGKRTDYYGKNIPFSGEWDAPMLASEKELFNFQENALNNEALALSFLVEGVTLQIDAWPESMPGADIAPRLDTIEKVNIYSKAVRALGNNIQITVTLPENCNGIINIEITAQERYDEQHPSWNKNYSFEKMDEKIIRKQKTSINNPSYSEVPNKEEKISIKTQDNISKIEISLLSGRALINASIKFSLLSQKTFQLIAKDDFKFKLYPLGNN